MASLNVYSALVVLFLTCRAARATKQNDQIIMENNCETKIGLPCTRSISNNCWGELVMLGKVCLSALVKRALENPLFKDLSPATIITKSIQTWNNFLALIDSPSPSA
ncbi:hypothetical protein ES332_D05G383500v1 [Gossypium tomentosum]|uniref:Prolamin-like domain-containing protein n=1 Tax=Gossypium tomentosum TaxID=34277 RepID=A0A5D2L506_GOSTO|nr:hypothetical protein ES332_D05G383500v1 [Gossypium tomentosum]